VFQREGLGKGVAGPDRSSVGRSHPKKMAKEKKKESPGKKEKRIIRETNSSGLAQGKKPITSGGTEGGSFLRKRPIWGQKKKGRKQPRGGAGGEIKKDLIKEKHNPKEKLLEENSNLQEPPTNLPSRYRRNIFKLKAKRKTSKRSNTFI